MGKFDNLVLTIGDDVKAVMEERGVHIEEVKEVIGTAEETGMKLRNEAGTLSLAKLMIGEIFFYAVYEPQNGGYKVLDAYLHTTTVTGW